MRRHVRVPHAVPAGFLALLALAALSCASLANLPNPFASATPTATPTFTPSPTPSLTPSPTPPPSGRLKQAQPDGSILFTDYDAGYRITSPTGWRAVTLEEQDVQLMIDSLGDEQQELKDLLEQYVQPNHEALRVLFFKLIAYNGATLTCNINIAAESNSFLRALTVEEILEITADSLPSMVPGIRIGDSGAGQTAAQLEYGYMFTRWTVKDRGRTIPLVQKYVVIQTGANVITLVLTAHADLIDGLLPDFDAMVDSFELLEP